MTERMLEASEPNWPNLGIGQSLKGLISSLRF